MKQLLVDINQLAIMLAINIQTILKHRSGVRICPRLAGLPDPYENRPKLLWWLADIEAWAESRRTFRLQATSAETIVTQNPTIPPPHKKRGPGRPTNAEKFGVRE